MTDLTRPRTALHRRVEMSASVYNLFDKKYFAPATADLSAQGLDVIPREALTFGLTASYAF